MIPKPSPTHPTHPKTLKVGIWWCWWWSRSPVGIGWSRPSFCQWGGWFIGYLVRRWPPNLVRLWPLIPVRRWPPNLVRRWPPRLWPFSGSCERNQFPILGILSWKKGASWCSAIAPDWTESRESATQYPKSNSYNQSTRHWWRSRSVQDQFWGVVKTERLGVADWWSIDQKYHHVHVIDKYFFLIV